MAGQIGLASVTQLQKLAQEQLNDDSWEVRAFAEDTANILGATWPPRSYTCTFCRRAFRSAQALGGHMNVHRRDRARLQQIQSGATIHPSPSSLLFPTDEFVAGSGLCLFYPFPTAGSVFAPTSITPAEDFLDFPPSTDLSFSPYNRLSPCSPSSGAAELATLVDQKNNGNDDGEEEELDLELRLGQKPLN